MSETGEYSCNCAAHGCPMLGVASRSTTGSKEWFCMIHMGADAGRWQAITAELRRLVWLVEASRQIRIHAERPSMDQFRGQIHRDITMAQRSDLHQQDYESDTKWGIRLEDVLSHSCAVMIANPDFLGGAQ